MSLEINGEIFSPNVLFSIFGESFYFLKYDNIGAEGFFNVKLVQKNSYQICKIYHQEMYIFKYSITSVNIK